MPARHETGGDRLAADKTVIAEDFFSLSTGAAGERTQQRQGFFSWKRRKRPSGGWPERGSPQAGTKENREGREK